MANVDFKQYQSLNDDNFLGEHFEGYGDKWSILFKNPEDFMGNHLPECVQNSSILFTQEVNGYKHAALVYPDNSRMQILSLLKITEEANELISFYPLMKGLDNEFVLKSAYAWEILAEGEMAAETDCERLLNFFNPYFAKDIYNFTIDKAQNISLAGLAYCIEKLEEKEIPVDRGGFYEVQLKEFLEENPGKTEADFETPRIMLGNNFRMVISRETTSEFEAVGEIEDINYIDFFGTKVAILKVNFEHARDDEYLYCNVYASENVLGDYEPQIGDSISTVLWFTGYFN